VELHKTLSLPDHGPKVLEEPQHAVWLEDNTLFLSIGSTNIPQHLVCKMTGGPRIDSPHDKDQPAAVSFESVRSKLLRSYGGERGGGVGRLNYPAHMALHPRGDDTLIYVADCNNHRVLVLDSSKLQLRGVLLTREEDGIVSPYRLSYDADTNRLLVGGEGHLDVYRCSTCRRD